MEFFSQLVALRFLKGIDGTWLANDSRMGVSQLLIRQRPNVNPISVRIAINNAALLHMFFLSQKDVSIGFNRYNTGTDAFVAGFFPE
jgi:hypothetical protein